MDSGVDGAWELPWVDNVGVEQDELDDFDDVGAVLVLRLFDSARNSSQICHSPGSGFAGIGGGRNGGGALER